VKKQPKYNVTRWAVTGRDDLTINTACWRVYRSLLEAEDCNGEEWRELCYLWSSDFRTHITTKRWQRYRERLAEAEQRLGARPAARATACSPEVPSRAATKARVAEEGPHLIIDTQSATVRVNRTRGLAIDALWFGDPSAEPLLCTLPHGYYQDVRFAADFYTGHLVLETPGEQKVTDLSPVLPRIERCSDGLEVDGLVSTAQGSVLKKLRVYYDEPRIDLEYSLDWSTIPPGALRLGHVTLNPRAFDPEHLFYRTHNGGERAETFRLTGESFDHGQAISFLVSAAHGIGITEGVIEIGDDRARIGIDVDKCAAAVVGLVTFLRVDESYFCRLALSLRELDETSSRDSSSARPPTSPIRVTLRKL
jgi:hypothetical protein